MKSGSPINSPNKRWRCPPAAPGIGLTLTLLRVGGAGAQSPERGVQLGVRAEPGPCAVTALRERHVINLASF